MEEDRHLFQANLSEAKKASIIVKNTLKMLSRRIYIDKDGEKHPLIILEEAEKSIQDVGDNTYTIKADNGVVYAIKVIFQKLTSVTKQSAFSEFLLDYSSNKYKKIVVATEFNNKIAELASKNQTQMFEEHKLLQDIADHQYQPKFQLLTPKQIERVKEEYNANNYTIKKFVKIDPMIRYFALKRGDVVRIIRPSPTAGFAIDYRIYA